MFETHDVFFTSLAMMRKEISGECLCIGLELARLKFLAEKSLFRRTSAGGFTSQTRNRSRWDSPMRRFVRMTCCRAAGSDRCQLRHTSPQFGV